MSLQEDFEQLVIRQNEQDERIENLEAADVSRTFPGDVTTTNATPTLILQFSTASNTTYTLEATFSAIRTDVAGDTASYLRTFRIRNIGGAVSVFDMVVTNSRDNAAWNITRSVSGTNVDILATGVAAQTIKWTMLATVLQVS